MAALISGIAVFGLFSGIGAVYGTIVIVCAEILTVESYMRLCLIHTVRCYQHYAKEETRRRCKCIPSCSEYAVTALKRVYPLFVAAVKISKRLFHTCNGCEYIVDFPFRKMNDEFEHEIQ